MLKNGGARGRMAPGQSSGMDLGAGPTGAPNLSPTASPAPPPTSMVRPMPMAPNPGGNPYSSSPLQVPMTPAPATPQAPGLSSIAPRPQRSFGMGMGSSIARPFE
jgi:hypothetical protein